MSEHQYIMVDKSGQSVFNDDDEERKHTNASVKDLNDNSLLPQPFLCCYANILRNKLDEQANDFIINEMSYDYYLNGCFLSFSGYPHDEEDSYLTELKIFDPKYHVFNIKTGDSLKAARVILKRVGYETVRSERNYGAFVFKKGDIEIRCEVDNYLIKTLELTIKTFYLGNRIY